MVTSSRWTTITPLLRIAAVLAFTVAIVTGIFAPTPVRAAANEVVALSTTLSGAEISNAFTAAGETLVSKTPAQWGAMTTADFAAYDAVVLSDPHCTAGTGNITAAIANASTWGAAVDGNVIVIGTDEDYHVSQGGQALMNGAAAFVVADSTKTGAYISLSCYYHGTAAGTSVGMLDTAFGGTWTMTGVGCYNNAHIVATHPAFTGASVTDTTLSNWSCSVHEAFDAWPINFEVLAVARDLGSAYTAPDGSVGTPYIVARGVEVISDIDLTPATATNFLGETHTLTAVVTTDDPTPGTPIIGTTVTFTVVAGPHVGTTGTGVTDSTGTATWSYVGSSLGLDTIEATFVDALGRTQRSNRVSKSWILSLAPRCDGLIATIIGTPGNDNIIGTPGDDVIVGLAGEDNIDGKGGNDVICGNEDHDQLEGGDGNDRIFGGDGPDRIWGQDGDDFIFGGDGDDVVYGGNGRDSIDGGAGNDRLKGDNDDDRIFGGAGDDTLDGEAGNDFLQDIALVGNNRFYGGDGNDLMVAGPGNDTFYAGAGDDIIRAGAGSDRLRGEGGNDLCDGGVDLDTDVATDCEIETNTP